MKLENINIVITGANSGIGLEVLKLLRENTGNHIVAADREVDVLEKMSFDGIEILKVDVASEEGVNTLFSFAYEKLKKIDLFFANAGYSYYEEINYINWQRCKDIFDTNVLSPIYSYQKYREHLAGDKGIFAITISAIGEMAMPGFALYSATKYALNGLRQSLMMEKPQNMQLTCLYPIATDTNFFATSSPFPYEKPFPIQSSTTVAKKFIKGVEKGRAKVYPSSLYLVSKFLLSVCPLIKKIYLTKEKKKFLEYKKTRDEIINS